MNNINELKRIKDTLTLLAGNSNDAITLATDFLLACGKQNAKVTNAKLSEEGLYSVNVLYDATYNTEDDYKYIYSIK